ncbi:TPA: hypothetical protein V1F97_001185 [Streptococcus pneumoniae]|nr:hypothetical protein [Streptococcus pneumoniae]
MNTKIKNIITSFSYVISSNLLIVLTSSLVVLIFPKIMGVTEYSYWQLYIFYLTYIGFFHLGWIDGIYLKYGGLEYTNLDRKQFYSQMILFSSFLMLISLVLFTLNLITVRDENARYIYNMAIISMIVTNLRTLYVYILQMTNRLKDSSVILISDRVLYVLLLFTFIVFGWHEYKVMIWADILGRTFSLMLSFWICKDIVFQPLSKFILDFKESLDNIRVGINLMLSNIASSMIIGIVRMGIQWNWNIETFGKVSLTLSISNLLMTFINAIGLVIFPLIKRTKTENLPKIYSNLRNALMLVMFAILLFYYPLKFILDIWLPAYKDALVFMALIFPMSVYEGKMALVINTYLKAMRMEKDILKINALVMLTSIVVTLVTTILLNNLGLTVVSIVILLALRSIIAELILSKKLKISVKQDIALELLMTIIFISSSWYLSIWIAVIIYLLAYTLYLYLKHKDIRMYIEYFKNHKKIS